MLYMTYLLCHSDSPSTSHGCRHLCSKCQWHHVLKCSADSALMQRSQTVQGSIPGILFPLPNLRMCKYSHIRHRVCVWCEVFNIRSYKHVQHAKILHHNTIQYNNGIYRALFSKRPGAITHLFLCTVILLAIWLPCVNKLELSWVDN